MDYTIEFDRLHRINDAGDATHSWELPAATIDRVCHDVDLGGDEPVDMVILSDGRVVVVGLYDSSIVAQIFAILDDAHYSIDGVELTEV